MRLLFHYTGKLLDGKVFDSSQKTGQPIQLQIGVGMVIPGWDDAILKLKKGTKATLVIPSTMGYGPQGSPPAIPGNAVLVFDVDLVNVQKAPAAWSRLRQVHRREHRKVVNFRAFRHQSGVQFRYIKRANNRLTAALFARYAYQL